MPCTLSEELIKKTIAFHGHWCPGLAIGIRVSEWVLQELGRASDEEIVSVVETDMCAVDAIQYLTGCTFGKGNLIYKDYGKSAFTFYRRRDGKAARLVTRPSGRRRSGQDWGKLSHKMRTHGLTEEEETIWHETRAAISKSIMESDLRDLFEIKEPPEPAPTKAGIFSSLICESCGESVMEPRTRRFNDRLLCIPCFQALEKRY